MNKKRARGGKLTYSKHHDYKTTNHLPKMIRNNTFIRSLHVLFLTHTHMVANMNGYGMHSLKYSNQILIQFES